VSKKPQQLKKIFRPIVRWLINKNFSYLDVCAVLKLVFFEEAKELLLKEGKITASQISLMTGLHRKDIKQFLDAKPESAPVPKTSPLRARIFSTWLASSFAVDSENTPIAIPEKGEKSFESIASFISRDVAPGTILKEGIRDEYLTRNADGKIELNFHQLVSDDNLEERNYFFVENLADHAEAGVENVLSNQKHHYERAFYVNGIDESIIAELKNKAIKKADELLIDINKDANKLTENNDKPGEKRLRLGVYFYDDSRKRQ
jgi:hypothetical protein